MKTIQLSFLHTFTGTATKKELAITFLPLFILLMAGIFLTGGFKYLK
jgi:hypothetical protein